MSFYNITNNYNCSITPCTNGRGTVHLEIEIPAHEARDFIYMIDSLRNLFQHVNNKAKVARSYANSDRILEDGSRYYEILTNHTIETFKVLRKESTKTTRQLVSETLKVVKETYPNAYYQGVKDILTKSGMLKKYGFYTENKINKKTSL